MIVLPLADSCVREDIVQSSLIIHLNVMNDIANGAIKSHSGNLTLGRVQCTQATEIRGDSGSAESLSKSFRKLTLNVSFFFRNLLDVE